MKSYWQNLNERDRWALGAGVVIVSVYLLYLLVISPIITVLEQKSLQHVDKKQTLAWMTQVRGQQTAITRQKSLSNSQLLSLLATRLKNPEFRPFPYQLQQIGSGDIQLSFDAVPFIPFVKWLKQLNQSYAFSIKQFNAQRIDTVGLAKINLIISAS